MFAGLRRFLSAVLSLTRPYWVSEDRWRARGLLAMIVAMTLGLVYVNVLFSNWNNRFYDALQQHDFGRFGHELGYFCVLAMVFIVIAVYQTYLTQMLQIRWRRWLTDRYVHEWLGQHAYYHLQHGEYRADNPDQRIADDLQLFIDATLSLGLGLLSSVVTLASFATILWRLSGTLDVPLGNVHVVVPGYMLWIALVYAACGTWLTQRIGRPLIRLNFQQQQFEANFRFSMARMRENTEAVAFYRGECEEARGLGERFTDVVGNWWAIMRRQKRLTWFTAGYGQVAVVFPILAAAPRYFAGLMQLGALMQTAQAFGQVQSALSWFVTGYTQLAAWKATTDRLTGFRDAISKARTAAAASRIVRVAADSAQLSVRNLKLDTPHGTALTAVPDLDISPGEAWLISGRTGAGKSSLLRALAGIWPYGSGTIASPEAAHMLFLPQKPYLPMGTLRRVLAYPRPPTAFDDEMVREALDACGLPQLTGRLDESQNWGLLLSPGEQQRIAFARALLQRPAWLFLDEATAALDEPSEAQLYRVLRQRLPGLTVISVGHRRTLVTLHDRRLDLGEGGLVDGTHNEAASSAIAEKCQTAACSTTQNTLEC